VSVFDLLVACVPVTGPNGYGVILLRAIPGHCLARWTGVAALFRSVAIGFGFRGLSVRLIPAIALPITLRQAGMRLAGCLVFGKPLSGWC
jgi:hypothetical protein